ncbi:hypothetical protein K439DRAFT_1337578 [Ramaria rubella]|nr:hypothetical protein K439DRAFT_1337578 [Ramaria rubella]
MTALQSLQECLLKCGIQFNAVDSLVRCFAHVVNLCCQDVIASITNKDLLTAPMDSDSGSANPAAGNSAPTFPRPFPTCPSMQIYAEACVCDPIALGRHIVTSVHASGQRRDDFAAVIAHGNNHGEWEEQIQLTRVDGKVQVPKLQLLRDVDTCWDSVYGMAQRLRILQQVSISIPSHLSIQLICI